MQPGDPASSTRTSPPEASAIDDRQVPDAVAPPPHHPRFALFDGLRAIAVLSVLLVHTPGAEAMPDPWPQLTAQLSIGVSFFFVISGFLLYRPFIAERAGGPERPALTGYAKRRFLRIYPAYWLALTALTVLPEFAGIEGQDGPIAQYSLLHTLPVIDGPACSGFSNCDLAHTWSLVVELTFYALLPLYALAVARLTRRFDGRRWMRVELALLAALAIVATMMRFVLFQPPSPFISLTILGGFLPFSVGMGLAVASVVLAAQPRQPLLVRMTTRHPLALWLAAIAMYIALCLWVPEEALFRSQGDQVVVSVVFGVVGLLLVLPAVFGEGAGGLPRRVLGHRLMAWLGLISYGVFLWHFAVAGKFVDHPYGLALAGTLTISVAIAALSYYLVERPILRLKNVRLGDLLIRRRASPARGAPSIER